MGEEDKEGPNYKSKIELNVKIRNERAVFIFSSSFFWINYSWIVSRFQLWPISCQVSVFSIHNINKSQIATSKCIGPSENYLTILAHLSLRVSTTPIWWRTGELV